MADRVLVDTGPLVALLQKNDAHHASCRELFAALRPPLFTCRPVLTETCWLLRRRLDLFAKILLLCERGTLVVLNLVDRELPLLGQVLTTYGDREIDLADATLIYLARRERIDSIATLDRTDFSIYRNDRGESFKLLPDKL